MSTSFNNQHDGRSADSISDRALPKLDKYSYPKYEPSTMINFLLNIGGAVRMVAQSGDELENFLDARLERETSISLTRPAFLNDPDLEPPAPAAAVSSGSDTFSGKHGTKGAAICQRD